MKLPLFSALGSPFFFFGTPRFNVARAFRRLGEKRIHEAHQRGKCGSPCLLTNKQRLKQGLLSAPKTASGSKAGEDFVAGGQEGFLPGGEPTRSEPSARILPCEVTI